MLQGIHKIGYLGQADAFGKSGEVGLTAGIARYGQTVTGVVTYRRGQDKDGDMREQVSILRKSGAEAVVIFGIYGPISAFIRDARRAGWNVPVATVSFAGPDDLLMELRLLGWQFNLDFTSQVYATQVVPSPSQTRYPLVAGFREHMPPGTRSVTALEGWLNAAVVTEALRRAGRNPSRTDFVGAMESLGGWDPGIGVRLGFSPSNHQGLHNVWLAEIRQFQWEPVEMLHVKP